MRKLKIRYEKNPHQKEFHEDLTSKFLHLSTGFAGGKSYALCMKMLQLSRLNQNLPGGLIAPTYREFKRDVHMAFEEILDTNNIPFKWHNQDQCYKFPWTKAPLFVATAERKLRGPNWAYAGVNEVTLIEHQRYKEIIGRVRVKGSFAPQIASNGTPEGTDHWLYEVFIEKPMEGSRIIYGDTRANAANLSPDYIKSLESSYDQIMLDAYLRGMFVNMKGNRFYYAYDPKVNDSLEIERIPHMPVHVSLDYNVSPMIATLWHIIPLQNLYGTPMLDSFGQRIRTAVAFDQIVIEDGADTEKMAQALYANDLHPDTTYIYPDPAGNARSTKGPPDNTILRNAGWLNIRVKTVAPRFRGRQLAVCNLLSKGLIKLNPNKCKALKKDLEAVSQDKATFEKIKDNPKLTHASDGMDYFIDIEFPLSGNHTHSSGSIKYR